MRRCVIVVRIRITNYLVSHLSMSLVKIWFQVLNLRKLVKKIHFWTWSRFTKWPKKPTNNSIQKNQFKKFLSHSTQSHFSSCPIHANFPIQWFIIMIHSDLFWTVSFWSGSLMVKLIVGSLINSRIFRRDLARSIISRIFRAHWNRTCQRSIENKSKFAREKTRVLIGWNLKWFNLDKNLSKRNC